MRETLARLIISAENFEDENKCCETQIELFQQHRRAPMMSRSGSQEEVTGLESVITSIIIVDAALLDGSREGSKYAYPYSKTHPQADDGVTQQPADLTSHRDGEKEDDAR